MKLKVNKKFENRTYSHNAIFLGRPQKEEKQIISEPQTIHVNLISPSKCTIISCPSNRYKVHSSMLEKPSFKKPNRISYLLFRNY